jgi:hypothetical protein
MRRRISSERVGSRSVTSNEAEMPNEWYVGMTAGGGDYGSANLLKVDENMWRSGRWRRMRWLSSEKGSVALCFIRLVCVSELVDALPRQ